MNPSETFSFLPDEIGAGAVQGKPFTATLQENRRKRKVLAMTRGGWLWVRDYERTGSEWNCVSLYSYTLQVKKLPRNQYTPRRSESELLREQLALFSAQAQLGKRFAVLEDETFVITLGAEGHGMVRNAEWGSAEFAWSPRTRGEIFSWSSSQVRADWETLRYADDCDFEWALEWLRKTPEDRERLRYGQRHGTLEELETVLRWAAHSDVLWWDWNPQCTFIFSDGHEGAEVSLIEIKETPRFRNQFMLEVSRLTRFNQIFSEYFGLYLRDQELDIHPVFKEYLNRSKSYSRRSLRNVEEPVIVAVERPTAHERLEAMFALREWLQGKVPTDELKALFG